MKALHKRNKVLAIALLLLAAFAFRVVLVRTLPNDAPQDGLIYDQTALNLTEHHVYSQASEPPYSPSFRRMPGYPIFLAGVYSLSGHNKTAVRMVQALMDTVTCAMIGMVAFLWEPDKRRRKTTTASAIALAAICPFTAIYTATILTETCTMFFAVAMSLAATLALTTARRHHFWWIVCGLLAGVSVLFRADSGLYALALGLTLLIVTLSGTTCAKLQKESAGMRSTLSRAMLAGLVFSTAFCIVLLPWAIRNYRVFHLFQPLSPAHGEMPGEFVPRGYLLWVQTWIDDDRYIGPVIWSLDALPISSNTIPEKAFDSAEEKLKLEQLLASYNGAGLKLTPEIDAGFAEIARQRISRYPIRHYVWLPLKRAASLWVDTHSQYYPFQGHLLPLSRLNGNRQGFWLLVFAAATLVYTLLGIAGAWILWRTAHFNMRWPLLLAALMILPRVAFFAAIERPEPRYVVEVFPFLSVLGGIALARLPMVFKTLARI